MTGLELAVVVAVGFVGGAFAWRGHIIAARQDIARIGSVSDALAGAMMVAGFTEVAPPGLTREQLRPIGDIDDATERWIRESWPAEGLDDFMARVNAAVVADRTAGEAEAYREAGGRAYLVLCTEVSREWETFLAAKRDKDPGWATGHRPMGSGMISVENIERQRFFQARGVRGGC